MPTTTMLIYLEKGSQMPTTTMLIYIEKGSQMPTTTMLIYKGMVLECPRQPY